MKKQVYLHFSEAPPKFKGQGERNIKFQRVKVVRKHTFLSLASPTDTIGNPSTLFFSNDVSSLLQPFSVQRALDSSTYGSELQSRTLWTGKTFLQSYKNILELFSSNPGQESLWVR